MAVQPYIPQYHNISVNVPDLGDFKINYVEAGSEFLPTVLLLHGFPSSTTQFRDFIPLLSANYHVLAPDLPGFGLTESPKGMKFTFENLTKAISAWLVAVNVTSYAVYIFDYGAPVALRMALEKPEQIKAIISQNGNAYDAGFGHPFWDPIMALWKSNNSQHDRDILRENVLTIATNQYQYYTGVPDKDYCLVDPLQPVNDYYDNLMGKENQEHQLDLFYDYRTNKELYPKFHEYFRKYQPPFIAIWGKNDPAFIYPGAEAFKQDFPHSEIILLDAGHFALETKRWEIARIMLNFLSKIGY